MKRKQPRPKPQLSEPFGQGVCELVSGEHPNPLTRVCARPAVLRYPAMGGGYMRLCAEHGEKHRSYCGEWNGERWSASPYEDPEPDPAVPQTPEGVRADQTTTI